ncbi:MAG: hydrogenase maturation protease [Bryobacteraceae bacterium]|jgi:hydrogenase maturation protease
MSARVRVLGLGNEILADDALGILAARELAKLFSPDQVEVVESSESGLHLLDHVTNVRRLVVIDTVQTGHAAPGTIFEVREQDVRAAPGTAAHGTGLFDALALARKLGFDVAQEVTILAVEAADCLTLGGPMHPAVAAALPQVMEQAKALIAAP